MNVGRKPKPVARQISEGDPRKKGKRKLQERLAAEPKPTSGLPPCPAHLHGRARTAWKFFREELRDLGLDFRPDAMMLEGVCTAYARALQADLMLAAAGLLVEQPILDNAGKMVAVRIKAHPLVAVSHSAWKMFRSFASEFGLSPVARLRLAIETDNGEGDLLSILSRPRQQKVPPIQ
jgi:P27 family predicted phage terminase small subunit